MCVHGGHQHILFDHMELRTRPFVGNLAMEFSFWQARDESGRLALKSPSNHRVDTFVDNILRGAREGFDPCWTRRLWMYGPGYSMNYGKVFPNRSF